MTAEGSLRRRRIYVAGPDELGALAGPIAAWTDRLGYARVPDRRGAHLEVRSAERAPIADGAAWIAVCARRLDALRQAELRAQGAVCVLDGHHGLLDLAYAFAEQLFEQRAEQRRHGLLHGRLEVGLRSLTGASGPGRLVGLNRCGAWIDAPGVALGEGALVELAIEVEDRTAQLRGRVVGDRDRPDGGGPLLAIELALDQGAELRSFRRLARRAPSPRPHTGDVPSPA